MRKSGTPSSCGVCLIFPPSDDRFSRCVSWFLLLQERVLSLKSKMYDSLEKTPPRPRDLFYIFPLLLFCADGVQFYTLSLEKWYGVIPTAQTSVVFFCACSIPFSKVLSILKVVKDAEKLSFFLRLSGCLIKKRVSFLQKSVWHKDEEEKKSCLEKNRFFINFLLPLQFFERSLKCLLILKVWNLAARSS